LSQENNYFIKFFEVEVKNELRTGYVYAPSSIMNPHDNTVMFITSDYVSQWERLLKVKDCLVFWPVKSAIPDEIATIHFLVPCDRPRLEFARFYKENGLYDVALDKSCNVGLERFKDKNVTIMPNAYVGERVTLGNNVYIGSGVRLVGKVQVGNNVVIRENSVLGADGLSMEREDDGTTVPIPQFGGVVIGDNVLIGANVVIARGAIDNTIIKKGCMIDNCCFISHNVILEENVVIVGESIVFGSCHIEKNSFISGNATLRDSRKIGENAFIGMGSVVLQDVLKGSTVCGNPAKSIRN